MQQNTQLIAEKITQDIKVIFVSDLYVEDQVGNAELTTQALVDSCPFEYVKLRSQEVNLQTLQAGHHCHWVFGNFAGLDFNLVPTIVGNMKYSIIEHDFKYCRFRSPEKHYNIQGTMCDCHSQMNGKIISAFFQGAQSLWWMSEVQKELYLELFPFLAKKDNIVLSSVFDKKTLGTLKWLRSQFETSSNQKNGWITPIISDTTNVWCKENVKHLEDIQGLTQDGVMDKLTLAEGFIFLPSESEPCNRIVIEAKLLGCQLHLNDNVQHAKEEWFATDDLESIHDYLYAAPGLFWNSIKNIMEYQTTISGYTTTYNCISQEYPYMDCIKSMLNFCNEVCVVDGGSTDGTWESLVELSNQDPRVKVKQVVRDWNHPRHAVFDGMQKAEARAMCTGEFCWQMDSDEILPEGDAAKVAPLASGIPKQIEIVSLPVVDFWGKDGKVRIDVTPWKWRLSRNLPHVTHGIPKELRKYDSNGDLYAAQGTDGCCMIHKETGERLGHVTFVTNESESVRMTALSGNPAALENYQTWFNQVLQSLPSVRHYSWYNLPRKIKTYKNYWSHHWESLFNVEQKDTAENNMFFDRPWSEVTDDDIEQLANKLSEIGGWVWHRKWDGTRTPSIRITNV